MRNGHPAGWKIRSACFGHRSHVRDQHRWCRRLLGLINQWENDTARRLDRKLALARATAADVGKSYVHPTSSVVIAFRWVVQDGRRGRLRLSLKGDRGVVRATRSPHVQGLDGGI